MSHSYIILGGDGVFGIHNAKYLLEKANPKKVVCVGRNPRKALAYTLNVGKGDPRFEYHQIHCVFELDRIRELFDRVRPDVIINYAALAYATSWEKSFRYYETNVVSLCHMVDHVAQRDYLQRWVQIGSSEVYGSNNRPVDEEAVLRPTSPYAVSKMAGDLHLLTYINVVKNFKMNILRPSNAYGEGQQPYRILPRAVICALAGTRVPLQGGGTVKKSYLHAQDLASAVQAIVEKAPTGRIYNCGPREPQSIRSLVEEVARQARIPFDRLCDITPGRTGEDATYWLDSKRIESELGWKPVVTVEEGVQRMMEWGRQNLDFLKNEPVDFVLRA